MKLHNIQKKHKSTNGFALVEIMVAAAVLSTSMLAITFFYQQSIQVVRNTGETIQATFLLEEGVEATKTIRDESWDDITSLSTSTPYYLEFVGSKWATTATSTMISSLFDRTITLDDVFRDSNQDIVATGTLDEKIKKLTVTVSWMNRTATTTKTVSTYIADLFN